MHKTRRKVKYSEYEYVPFAFLFKKYCRFIYNMYGYKK